MFIVLIYQSFQHPAAPSPIVVKVHFFQLLYYYIIDILRVYIENIAQFFICPSVHVYN